MSCACVAQIPPAHGQKAALRDVELNIAHIEGVSLSEAMVDRILAAASLVIQKQDSPSDTACPVNLKRKAKLIALKEKDLPEAIDSYEAMAHLADLPGDVKVVKRIGWCGYFGVFLGCAGEGEGLMAVVPNDGALEDILWAHEFGHTTGLPHTAPPLPRRMMLDVVGADHRDVTSGECAKLTAKPLRVFGLKQKPDRRIFVLPTPLKPQPGAQAPLPPIRQFVRQLWIHGVPYDIASRYGADVVPELLAMLGNKEDRPYWSNAVQMVGLTGSKEQVPALIAFFQRGEPGQSESESRAKNAVLLALGFLQNRSPSPAARDFLLANTNPNRIYAPWMPKRIDEFQARSREIARTAAVGLAFSGEPAAGTRLAEIQVGIERGAFSLKSIEKEPHDMINELRKVHEIISKQGLGGYLRAGAK